MNRCRRTKGRKQNFRRLSRAPVLTAEERLQSSFMRNPENTCASSSDIPGFHYDAEKKRYFRLLPGNNNDNPLTTDSIKLSNLEKLRKTKSKSSATVRPNIGTKFLRNRSLSTVLLNPQRGFASPSAFRAFIQEERMSNFKCVSRVVTENILELSADKCKYLLGCVENGMFLGAWSTENEGLLIHSLNLETESNRDENILRLKRGSVININYANFQLADLCFAKLSHNHIFALYVGNYQTEERNSINTIHLMPIRDHCDTSTPENRELIDAKSQHYEFSGKHFWSCYFDNSTKAIFAGSEGVVNKYGVMDGCSFFYKIPNENIFSLTTNCNGQTLYAGTNKGNLIWFDTRSNALVGNMKIGRGTSYIKLLTDENKIIASSFDDSLIQVDLREQKVLFNYPEHKNEHRKLPFSIDELSDVLCSVGQDRITRLWSLHNGKILTSVLPPEMPLANDSIPEPWVWYSDHWNTKSKNQKTCLVVAAENETFLYCSE